MKKHNTQDLCGKLDENRGYNMNTCSGLPLWPADPQPEDIRIDDICGSLSRICRFNGHLKRGTWVNTGDIPLGAYWKEVSRNQVFVLFIGYSVAQHSLAVEKRVSAAIDALLTKAGPLHPWEYYQALRLAALLHDANEFINGDMIKPQKTMYAERKTYEHAGDLAIAARFDFDAALFNHPLIKEADYRMFLTEKRDVCNTRTTDFGVAEAAPYPEQIIPILSDVAEVLFRTRLMQLYTGE